MQSTFPRLRTRIIQNILLLLSLTAIILVLLFPSASSTGAMTGLVLWCTKVLPSLFPFMVITSFMYFSGLSQKLTQSIYLLLRRFLPISQNSVFIFLTSVLSGYPMAAKLVSLYCKDNRLTGEEAEKVLAFSSVAGPVFISSSIGFYMLNDLSAASIIALSHYISCLLSAILFSLLIASKPQKQRKTSALLIKADVKKMSKLNALTHAVTTTCSTQLLIGGFITLFSVTISLLDACGFFSALSSLAYNITPTCGVIAKPFIAGILEMANGSALIANTCVSMELKIMLITFFISWSSLSILCQALGLLAGTPVSPLRYIYAKFLHGMISLPVSFLLIKLLL